MTANETVATLSERFIHLSLLDEPLPEETSLSEDQAFALEKILSGENCYVYGPGGTGKSVLLKTAVKKLREEMYKTVAVTATTGIASEAIDGVTIHSIAGCGVVKNIHFLGRGLLNDVKREAIKKYDVLFIDEISMLSGEMFDRLSEHFGIVRENPTQPFGGMQVVVFGDFLQLQPIEQLKSKNSNLKAVCPALMLDRGLCFQSFTWDMLNFTFCELKTVFRQEDETFANLLSRVRRGEQAAGREIIEYVASQGTGTDDDDQQFEIKLTCTNDEANKFNKKKLAEFQTEECIYEAVDSVLPCVDETHDRYESYCKSLTHNWQFLKGQMRAEEKVTLKVGCEVMMLINTSVLETNGSESEERRLANGSRGTIIKFDLPDEAAMNSHIEKLGKQEDTNQRDLDLLKNQREWVRRKQKKVPYVLFRGFQEAVPIFPMEFSFDSAGLGKNIRFQIPIKLAFAITIHKSQGMSLDSCLVDASKTFADAQVYVALSRCRSATGLRIENLKPSAIKAPRAALEFYDNLNDPSKPPNRHKWWQDSPTHTRKERAAINILRQYYDPRREEHPNGSFSEYLSVRNDRMRRRVSDEQLGTVPGWRCEACCNKREYSLECCFLAREQVDKDIAERTFDDRKRSSVEPTSVTTDASPSIEPSNDNDDDVDEAELQKKNKRLRLEKENLKLEKENLQRQEENIDDKIRIAKKEKELAELEKSNE
jgi:ATP-dependent DNA helicase PIF1